MSRNKRKGKYSIVKPYPIYVILETGSIAGGVRVVFEIALGLRRRGWYVEILSLSEPFDWFPLEDTPWQRFQNYRELEIALLQKRGYKLATWWNTAETVAHCSLPGEGWYLVQDIETNYYYEPLIRKAVLLTYRLPLHKITTSQWALSQVPDMTWIGNAVRPYRRNPKVETDPTMVLSIMRLQALKGFTLLSETARRLAHEMPESRLVTFSAWHGVTLSQRHTHTRLPSDRDVRNLYSEAGVFLSTSQHEGFSLSPLEAMTAGVAVVQTDADGNMEYSVHGENCLIAADAGGLVEAVKQVMTDDELRARLIANGYQTVKPYTWDKVLDRVEAELERRPL